MLSTKLTQYFCIAVVVLSSILVQADVAAQEAIQFSGSIVIDIQGGSSRRRSEMSQELQELVNATSFIPKIQLLLETLVMRLMFKIHFPKYLM